MEAAFQALRRAACRLMGGECLGKNAVDLIGPAAVVLDDVIDDLCHGADSSAWNNVSGRR